MNFRDLRKSVGMTQQELAKALNVKQTTISKWEQGKSSPTVNKIKIIACALRISEADILDCF